MAILDIFKRRSKEPADKQSSKAGLTSEIGVAGDVVFTGFKDEEARADKVSIENYRKMIDTDTTAEALFNIVTLPILATTHHINADKDDTDETQANFTRKNLLEPPHKGGMDTPFSLFLDQLLLSTVDGFQLFEKVYKIEDGKYVYKKLANRDSVGITLKRSKDGGYGGAVQRVNYGGEYKDVTIAAYKTFLFTYGKSRSFLYGRSAFRSAYVKYDKKRRLEYLDSIAAQAYAITPKLLKRTESGALGKEGKSARNKALVALAKLGEVRPVASIPYGWDVEPLTSDGRMDMGASIERQNSEMARVFLAPFLLLGSQGKSSNVGSYALSADQSDMFMIALKGLMTKIEEHINQYLIADLIDLNFPDQHYPEFHFDDLTSDAVKAIKEAFMQLVKKDRVSNEMAEGIEKSMAGRLEIDLAKLKKEREKRLKKEAEDKNKEFRRANDKKNGGRAGNGDKFLSDNAVLESLGIDTSQLGCVMLDVERLDVLKYVDNAKADLSDTEMDYSNVPAEEVPHVTLLFGLMKSAHEFKDQVDQLLEDIDISEVTTERVGSFDSGDDAVPIVAHVKPTPELLKAHDELTKLPHVNTYTDYQPHITLAYVKNDQAVIDKWVKALSEHYNGKTVKVTGVNYGDKPKDGDGKELNDQQWWRPLTEAEKIVRLADIEKRMNKMEQDFIDTAQPIIEKDITAIVDRAAKSDADSFTYELPKKYEQTLINAIKNAYNYAKTGAADELKVKAPATGKKELAGMQELTNFIVNKQQDDLKNLIRAEILKAKRTRQLAEEDDEEELTPEQRFRQLLAALLGTWIADKLGLTASSIISQGVNNGRNDVFEREAKDDDLFQYSGLLDDRICPICRDLDGKVVTREEWERTKWKTPIHFRCRCIWVLIRRIVSGAIDTALPDVTGLPDVAGGVDGPLI
jgi:2'-5' RNA ligase